MLVTHFQLWTWGCERTVCRGSNAGQRCIQDVAHVPLRKASDATPAARSVRPHGKRDIQHDMRNCFRQDAACKGGMVLAMLSPNGPVLFTLAAGRVACAVGSRGRTSSPKRQASSRCG